MPWVKSSERNNTGDTKKIGRWVTASERKSIEEERKKLQTIEESNKAIADFQAKQQEIQSSTGISGFLKKAIAGTKQFLGYGDTLPEIEGAPNLYKAQRGAQVAQNQANQEWLGRAQNFTHETIIPKIKEKNDEFKKAGKVKGTIEVQKGVIKNIGELASGTAKLAAEFSPLTGMSGIRKIINFVGGKPVEEYMDRNTPEYLKKIDGFIDETGILNYHPKYENELQKTGGEVSEIGSWFIPITRAGKVGKIEQALSELPNVAKVVGQAPKLVKVGGKLMYEVSKDIVDVATLDAIRGKNWDQIKSDVEAAGVGGAGLRIAGIPIKSLMEIGRSNKIIKSVENSLGKLDKEEKVLVSEMVKDKQPIDEIVTKVMAERDNVGKELVSKTKEAQQVIEEAVVKGKKEIQEAKETKHGIEIFTKDEVKSLPKMDASDFNKNIKPKTDKLRPLKEGETIVIQSGDGKYVDTDFKVALNRGTNKDTKVFIVKESDLQKPNIERANRGERLLPDGFNKEEAIGNSIIEKAESISKEIKISTPKTESPILKELNKTLDKASKMDELLPTTTFKKEFASAVKKIEADPRKAYNEALSLDSRESDATKTALQLAFLKNAQLKGDNKAIAELGMATARYGRKAGQDIVMFRSLYEQDPMNKLLIDFAKARLTSIESRFPRTMRKIIKEGGDIITSTRRHIDKKATEMLDAQDIIDKFICK